jgi:hypothetical protein
MSNVRDLVEKVTSLPGYTAQLSGGAEKSNSSTLLVAVDGFPDRSRNATSSDRCSPDFPIARRSTRRGRRHSGCARSPDYR